MIAFQIIAGLIIVLIFYKVLLRFKKKEITLREVVLWGLLWIGALYLIIKPESTSYFASKLGVGRGVDLVVYIALLILFYLNFKLFVKVEKSERQISKIVEELSFLTARENKKED